MAQNNLIYAGDISPEDTWKKLQAHEDAVLIDVRTPEEWAYVGVPDVSALGRECKFVPWLFYPRMNINPQFVQQVLETVQPVSEHSPLLFICRSGVRSASAAHVLTEMGHTQCYNVSHGFEGDPDGARHRGTINGWKVAGLPWLQG